MNIRTHDRSGLYRKLAARRAVRREHRELAQLLLVDDSPVLRQEIRSIYTRHNAQLAPSAQTLGEAGRGTV